MEQLIQICQCTAQLGDVHIVFHCYGGFKGDGIAVFDCIQQLCDTGEVNGALAGVKNGAERLEFTVGAGKIADVDVLDVGDDPLGLKDFLSLLVELAEACIENESAVPEGIGIQNPVPV